MQIADHFAGRGKMHRMKRNVILMCGCSDFETCHRAELVRLLSDEFEYVGEADQVGSSESIQMTLFGDPPPAPKQKKVSKPSPKQEPLSLKAEWVSLMDKARARYAEDTSRDLALIPLPSVVASAIQDELPTPIPSDTEFWCDLYTPL